TYVASLWHARSSNYFSFNYPPPTVIYTLSLHDALPISRSRLAPPRSGPSRRGCRRPRAGGKCRPRAAAADLLRGSRRSLRAPDRSEEHTSELQSRENLVCRLLLEKKKEYRMTKKLNAYH